MDEVRLDDYDHELIEMWDGGCDFWIETVGEEDYTDAGEGRNRITTLSDGRMVHLMMKIVMMMDILTKNGTQWVV